MAGSLRRWSQLQLVLLCGACAIAGAASGAHAEQLMGTVHYSGLMGPVSGSRPVLLVILENSAGAVVTTNGGTFTFNGLAAGDYTLAYVLDLNNDGRVSVGEPGRIYNNRSKPPGDTIPVPGPTLTLQLNDDTLVPGVSGTATYTGSKGTVSSATRIRVHGFNDPNLTFFANLEGRAKANGDRYDVIDFDTGLLYLEAFLDLNGNDNLDSGEPYQIYNHKGAPPGTGVVPGAHQTGINFSFGDENISGGPSPTPSPSPTPASATCVGDCDASGGVTVDEVITLVDMALGAQTQLSACPHGIPAGVIDVSGITVTVIIQAVKNASGACGAV